jgi:hypothetical protein
MGWLGATSAYGSLWEMLAGVTARLAGTSIVANVVASKLLSGSFLAGCAALVTAILRAAPTGAQPASSGALPASIVALHSRRATVRWRASG